MVVPCQERPFPIVLSQNRVGPFLLRRSQPRQLVPAAFPERPRPMLTPDCWQCVSQAAPKRSRTNGRAGLRVDLPLGRPTIRPGMVLGSPAMAPDRGAMNGLGCCEDRARIYCGDGSLQRSNGFPGFAPLRPLTALPKKEGRFVFQDTRAVTFPQPVRRGACWYVLVLVGANRPPIIHRLYNRRRCAHCSRAAAGIAETRHLSPLPRVRCRSK